MPPLPTPTARTPVPDVSQTSDQSQQQNGAHFGNPIDLLRDPAAAATRQAVTKYECLPDVEIRGIKQDNIASQKQNREGQTVVTLKNGNVETFSADGNLVSCKYQDGRTATYDADGTTRIFDKNQKVLCTVFTEKTTGQVLVAEPTADGGSKITYPDSTVQYLNQKDELVSADYPGGVHQQKIDGGWEVTAQGVKYTMDEGGLCKAVDYPDGRHVDQLWKDGKLAEVQVDRTTTYKFEKGKWQPYDNFGNKAGAPKDRLDLSILGPDGKIRRTAPLPGATVNQSEGTSVPKLPGEKPDSAVQRQGDREQHLKSLHDAIANKDDALVESECATLGRMTPDERRHALACYKEKYKSDLPSDLEKMHCHVGLANLQLDGRGARGSSEIANAEEAMDRVGKGDQTAVPQLRQALSHLTADQVKQLEEEHHISKQLDELQKQGKISQASADTCKLYLSNPTDSAGRNKPDFYRQLADIASPDAGALQREYIDGSVHICPDGEHLQLLREAFGVPAGNEKNPVVEAARKKYMTATLKENIERMQRGSGTSVADREAIDILKTGRPSLPGRILQNEGDLTNSHDKLENILKDLSPEERRKFGDGRKLCETLDAHPEIKRESLSQEQKESLQYYEDAHCALKRMSGVKFIGTQQNIFGGAENADLHHWEDLAEHGRNTTESNLSNHYSYILKNDGPAIVNQTLTTMSNDDWQLLHDDPQYQRRLKGELIELMGADKANASLTLIDQIAAAKDYDDYKKVSATANLNKSTKFSPSEGVNTLLNLSPEQRAAFDEKHKDDPQSKMVRKQVEDLVAQQTGIMKEVSQHLLERIKHGQSPALTTAERIAVESVRAKNGDITQDAFCKFAHDQLFGASDMEDNLNNRLTAGSITPEQYNQQITEERAQKAKLIEDLKSGNPKSADGKLLASALKQDIDSTHEQWLQRLIEHNGTVSLAQLNEYANVRTSCPIGDGTVSTIDTTDLSKLTGQLSSLDPKEKAEISRLARQHDMKALQQRFPQLTDQQIDLVVKVIDNKDSQVMPVDQLRLYALEGGRATDVVKLLHSLPYSERVNLCRDYAKKYDNADLLKDLGDNAPEGLKREILSQAAPPKDKYEESMQAVRAAEAMLSGPGRKFSRTWDSSGNRMDELLYDLVNTKDETKKQEIREKLAGAVADCRSTYDDVADRALDVATLATAIALAPETGGASLAIALGSSFVIGGFAKAGAHYAVGPNSYGNFHDDLGASLGRDFVSGGLNTFGTFAADPLAEGMLNKLIERSAAKTVESLVAKGVVAQADERLLESEVAKLAEQAYLKPGTKITDKQIEEALARAHVPAEKIAAAANMLRNQMQNNMINYARNIAVHTSRLATQRATEVGVATVDSGVQSQDPNSKIARDQVANEFKRIFAKVVQ